MSVAVIGAQNLTRQFGDFTAVNNVSFAVGQGEVFGFLGPNGAGKTTTIKMLTGLLTPTSGDANVTGLDVRTQAAQIRRRIGYMSQRFSLYGDLTVSENIELFGGLYGVPDELLQDRRAWVIEMAGIRGHERLLTAELPLGWKQRLALGCAVLHQPDVLFLDEPTSGVDPVARRAFWDLIYELSRGGTTVLVSTHYMEEAEYCNRVILMNRGKVIAEGQPAQLRTSFDEPIVEIRLAEAAAAVAVLKAEQGVEDAAMFGRVLHVTLRQHEDAVEYVRQLLEQRSLAAESVRLVSPSLEDVFVSLVRREGGAVVG